MRNSREEPSALPPAGHPPRIAVVIPARFASTRFPGKPLALLHGKSILQHVYERAALIRGIERLLVATDDARVSSEVRRFGGEVELTSFHHASGTDRIGEVLGRMSPRPEWVVNLQGDEPLFRPPVVERLLEAAVRDPEAIWTLAEPIAEAEEFTLSSVVKVVCAGDGRALYFSRSPVPFFRDSRGALPERPAGGALDKLRALRHLGVYAYPVQLLERFLALPASPLEEAEGLEQLRALEAGMLIRVLQGGWPDAGVDTPEDLRRLHLRYPRPEDLAEAGG